MLKILQIFPFFMFCNLFANQVAIDPRRSIFDGRIINNSDHSLIKARSQFLRINQNTSCAEHNQNLVTLGLSPHSGSRVNNVLTSDEFERLRNCGEIYYMQERPVNFLNLYRLINGPHRDMFMGANILNIDSYSYIATEAPYDRDDFYRMILDKKARIIVSLTTEKDDLPETDTFYPLRTGISVALHHLTEGDTVKIEDGSIQFISEIEQNDITTKILRVTRHQQEPYVIHHILVKKWMDGTLASSANDMRYLLKRIKQSESELNPHSDNPLVVNCGYGYGRTGILILMHQLMHQHDQGKLNLDTLDINSLMKIIEVNIAYGSPVGPNDRETGKERLQNIASEVFSSWTN